ncbi:MAG: hypothetical protein ABIJ61_10195 [bacterium]
MSDTPPHIEKLYREMLMSRSAGERLRMACRMFDTARTLMAAGIRQRNPDIDEIGLRTELFRQMYRQDFTEEELNKIISQMPNMRLESTG